MPCEGALRHAVCRTTSIQKTWAQVCTSGEPTVIVISVDLPTAGKECYGLGGCSSHPTHPAGTLGALPAALQPDNAHTPPSQPLFFEALCRVHGEGGEGTESYACPAGVQRACVSACSPHQASTAAAQDRVGFARCLPTPAPSTRAQEACTNKTRMALNNKQAAVPEPPKSRFIPLPQYGPHSQQVCLPDTLCFQTEAAAPQRWQVCSQRQPSKTHQAHVCMCVC